VKDPNEPKRPQTAFFRFSNTKRTELTSSDEEFKKLSFSDKSKRIGDLWKALGAEEKQPFDEAYKKEKGEYDIALAAYKATAVVVPVSGAILGGTAPAKESKKPAKFAKICKECGHKTFVKPADTESAEKTAQKPSEPAEEEAADEAGADAVSEEVLEE
jgi:hypothetical protein